MERHQVNWGRERWVKLYKRNTPSWCCLSLPARGLFCLLLKEVDVDGEIGLGRSGIKGLAVLLHCRPDEIRGELDELIGDGCVEMDDDILRIPNFRSAQETPSAAAVRVRKHRERKAECNDVTPECNDLKRSNACNDRIEEKKKKKKRRVDTPLTPQMEEALCHYESVIGRARTRSQKTLEALRARIKRYGVEAVKRGIDGLSRSPHHNGANEDGTKFLGLEYVVRSEEQLEKAMGWADRGPGPRSVRDATNASIIEDEVRQSGLGGPQAALTGFFETEEG